MSKITYVVAKDVKDLERIQDLAVKAVQSARAKVQIALVATMLHIGKHGDYTVANRLVEGLGNTVNGKAIVEWFVRFCGLSVADDASGFDGIVNKHADYIRNKLEDAKATMWWELKPANPFKGWSLDDALQAVIKQHKAAQEKLKGLSDEDKAKVSLKANDATIQQVLAICKFDELHEAANAADAMPPRAVAA